MKSLVHRLQYISPEVRMARATLTLALVAALGVGAGCTSEGGGGDEVLPGVAALVFVKRAYERADGTHNVAGGNNQTIDYLRYEPGGGLFVLTPPTPDGELRDLTESFSGVDVNGMDVSFDGLEVVFSMRREGDDHYHVYVASIDGSSPPRQLTFGDYHDVKPIWVPGDRIAFVTNQPYTAMGTRADEYNHSRVVTQIATISSASGDADRRLCSQNLSHTADPFLLSDGRIGFSRWEHLGPTNDVKLFAMNPDCTQMVALAGQHGKPGNSLVQMTEVREGVYVGITTTRDGTIQAGAMVQVDARALEGTAGIRLDEQAARYDVLTPSVPTGEESPPSGVGRYRRPFPVTVGGRDQLLVSWSDGDVNGRNELANTAPDFGIYLWDPETRRRTLVYDDPSMWDLYAQPARAREVPPVFPGVVGPAPDESQEAIIGSVDVTITSLSETVRGGPHDGLTLAAALAHTERVRIIEGFSTEIGPIREFGMTMHEGAAILGEAPVYEDGSWEAAVVPRLPYHLQPIDRYGLAIRNQLTWIQAMPGEQRRCGGCHEGRADTVLSRTGGPTLAQQAGPVDYNLPIQDRVELPWYGAASGGNIQDLFDDKCVSCHDGNAATDPFAGRAYTVEVTTEDGEELVYEVPYLRLTAEPVEVYYEDMMVDYPASYVTLMYPSAMMSDSVVIGDMPPIWVTPGSARESLLVEHVNAQAEDDADAWAWESAPHPENHGVTLTREERMMLVRMADLGGQYWSRRNVEGAEDGYWRE